MSVYDWPDEFKVRNYELAISPNLRSFAGTYSPTTDVTDLLGESFMLRVTLLPEQDLIRVAAREAFFDRLRGPSNQFRMGHAKMRAPNGTLRGLPVLSANVAQLSNGLTLNNCTNTNLLLSGGFEIDTNADGLGDGWTGFTSGGAPATTYSRNSGNGSTYGQRVSIASAVTVGNEAGVVTTSFTLVTSGLVYSMAADVTANLSGFNANLTLAWYTAADALISTSTTAAAVTTLWARVSMPGVVAPATAAKVKMSISGVATGSLASMLLAIDNVQLENAATSTPYAGPPTLLAGDMVSVNDQMVRVMASTVANDAGVMPVEFGPRARVAWTAGMAAVWNRPTALFRLVSNTAPVTRNPGGFADAMSFEALEYI